MNDRVILHSDLNNFFASVEIILNPQLAGSPVAVCGDPALRKGIVLAKCEIAKKFGIKTGDTVWMAKQKCPEIQIVTPRHKLYSEYSKKVRDIYYRFTDKIEPFGIDEAWLDVTASRKLFGTGEEIAHKIKQAVRDELGLTLSIGVSWNKTYAKIGSDLTKPDSVMIIDRANYKQEVWPLPVNTMLYVGRKTTELFRRLNIKTIGDLANTSAELLHPRLGVMAYKLVAMARGECNEDVAMATTADKPKSVGNGTTTRRDMTTMRQIRHVTYLLAEEVGTRLRKKGLHGQTINMSVRSSDLSWTGAQTTISSPTNHPNTITEHALEIFKKTHDIEKKPVRGLRVAVSNLSNANQPMQTNLFDNKSSQKDITRLFDKIRQKHGKTKCVAYGTFLDDDMDDIEIENDDEEF